MKTFQATYRGHPLPLGRQNAQPLSEEILTVRDDIGRHDAGRSVIGEALYRQDGFSSRLPRRSGRRSSENLFQGLRCRMHDIAAAGATIGRAATIARRIGDPTVSGARKSRMNGLISTKRAC
ncbi:MAG TPA: formate dehydrogenase accessory sulfurtransferase FdhD [Syntrophales bacterium]|nr:formate dehydrogenase accessory sulfurtransferase FdhD [Syntrophales bacterium]